MRRHNQSHGKKNVYGLIVSSLIRSDIVFANLCMGNPMTLK